MKRLMPMALSLAVVFAATAVLATSAFALELPEILPTSSVTRTWTAESEGEPQFKMLNSEHVELVVNCEKATGEGTEEPKKPLGLFHVHLLGCHTTIGGTRVSCTDLNHLTAGEILVLGTWHLVWDRENGKEFKELTTGVLVLEELAHFTCSIVLVELKGELLCLTLKPTEENTTHFGHCVANGVEQTLEWCKKDVAGKCDEPVKPKLETSISHSTFEPSADLGLGRVTTKEKMFADI
jgi:hypothetical protein